MPLEDIYYTTEEVSRILKVTRMRVIQLLQQGKLTGRLLSPRMWIISQPSLKSYIESWSQYPRKIDR